MQTRCAAVTERKGRHTLLYKQKEEATHHCESVTVSWMLPIGLAPLRPKNSFTAVWLIAVAGTSHFVGRRFFTGGCATSTADCAAFSVDERVRVMPGWLVY